MDKKDEEVQGGKKGGQENTLGVLRRPPQFADPVRKEQKSMAHRLGWGRECRKASINYQKTKRFLDPVLPDRKCRPALRNE